LSIPTTIAIDGPAASGKSTIGYELAKRLNYLYLDTGVMYRAVTFAALQEGINFLDEAAITDLAQRLQIDVCPPTEDDGRQYTVLIDGEDITWRIRDPRVEAGVSIVSAYRGVREALVRQQRHISEKGCVVMVGRDIGTIVLPCAELKLYLDARVSERALRRYRELRARGMEANLDEVLASMHQRDTIDSGREVSPLEKAEDAILIDTSEMTIEQVLEEVTRLISEHPN
jgi:cytidylate kinase